MQTVKLIPKGATTHETLSMTVFLNANPSINIVDDEILIRGKQYIFSSLELKTVNEDETVSKDFELSIRKGLQIKNAVDLLLDIHIDLATFTPQAEKKYVLNGQNDKIENGIYSRDSITGKLFRYTSTNYFDQYERGSLFKIKEGTYAGTYWFAPTTKKFYNSPANDPFEFLQIKESQLDISILDHFDDAFEANFMINATSGSILIPRPRTIPFPFIPEMETNTSRRMRVDAAEAGRDVDLIVNLTGSNEFSLFLNIESAPTNNGKSINIQVRNRLMTSFLKNLLQTRLIQGINSSYSY